jgi:hypothetical protein
MRYRLLFRLAVLASILQASSGCSWAFMQRPPEVVATPSSPVDCTSSRAAPVLDTICAGTFALSTVVLAGMSTCSNSGYYEFCIDQGTMAGVLAVPAGLAVLCGLSAGSGYGAARRCEGVKTMNALRITGNEDACRQLNSSWTPGRRSTTPAATEPAWAAPPVDVPVGGGCTKDVDCKGTRVCQRGVCVDPGAKRGP